MTNLISFIAIGIAHFFWGFPGMYNAANIQKYNSIKNQPIAVPDYIHHSKFENELEFSLYQIFHLAYKEEFHARTQFNNVNQPDRDSFWILESGLMRFFKFEDEEPSISLISITLGECNTMLFISPRHPNIADGRIPGLELGFSRFTLESDLNKLETQLAEYPSARWSEWKLIITRQKKLILRFPSGRYSIILDPSVVLRQFFHYQSDILFNKKKSLQVTLTTMNIENSMPTEVEPMMVKINDVNTKKIYSVFCKKCGVSRTAFYSLRNAVLFTNNTNYVITVRPRFSWFWAVKKLTSRLSFSWGKNLKTIESKLFNRWKKHCAFKVSHEDKGLVVYYDEDLVPVFSKLYFEEKKQTNGGNITAYIYQPRPVCKKFMINWEQKCDNRIPKLFRRLGYASVSGSLEHTAVNWVRGD